MARFVFVFEVFLFGKCRKINLISSIKCVIIINGGNNGGRSKYSRTNEYRSKRQTRSVWVWTDSNVKLKLPISNSYFRRKNKIYLNIAIRRLIRRILTNNIWKANKTWVAIAVAALGFSIKKKLI